MDNGDGLTSLLNSLTPQQKKAIQKSNHFTGRTWGGRHYRATTHWKTIRSLEKKGLVSPALGSTSIYHRTSLGDKIAAIAKATGETS